MIPGSQRNEKSNTETRVCLVGLIYKKQFPVPNIITVQLAFRLNYLV
jgi:hypothetical protein